MFLLSGFYFSVLAETLNTYYVLMIMNDEKKVSYFVLLLFLISMSKNFHLCFTFIELH